MNSFQEIEAKRFHEIRGQPRDSALPPNSSCLARQWRDVLSARACGWGDRFRLAIINHAEADQVQTIFRRYLKLKFIAKLIDDLHRRDRDQLRWGAPWGLFYCRVPSLKRVRVVPRIADKPQSAKRTAVPQSRASPRVTTRKAVGTRYAILPPLPPTAIGRSSPQGLAFGAAHLHRRGAVSNLRAPPGLQRPLRPSPLTPGPHPWYRHAGANRIR
jgi:hypothetical protein